MNFIHTIYFSARAIWYLSVGSFFNPEEYQRHIEAYKLINHPDPLVRAYIRHSAIKNLE